MSELIVALLSWIAAQTGLAMPPAPAVVLAAPQEMSERAAGRSDVRGLYDRATATVYMRDDWNPADLRDRASLLHELVHHLQASYDLPSQCPAERELLAYSLTLEWLRHQGIADPYAILNVDDLTIVILSMCPEG